MSAVPKSRNGVLLYRQLPEEYRYRDNRTDGEMGDLEAYLDGFGVLLDRIRGTLEQSYADAFAEPVDGEPGSNGEQLRDRRIQEWLIPYLAELVQADLLAPSPAARAHELDNSVGWYKTKGTLSNIDSIADVLGGVETMVVEGWKRTLTTPRLGLPPFAGRAGAAAPSELPLGTPDLRLLSRGVDDSDGTDPLRAFRRGDADAGYWRPLNPRGVPCFPGHYDDVSVRTPDLGNPEFRPVGPHPRRIHIYVQPPDGFFTAGLPRIEAPVDGAWLERLFDGKQQIGPTDIFRAIFENDSAPEAFVLEGELSVPAGQQVEITGVLIDGTLRVDKDARVRIRNSAILKLSLGPEETEPLVEAHSCLFGEIFGAAAFVQFEYVTVLGEMVVGRLNASDCLFAGALPDFQCADATSCVRYCRLPPEIDAKCARSGNNTTVAPRFALRILREDDGSCTVRISAFGEPGCGVLASDCDPAIAAGAEDRGEMGAYHDFFYAAGLRAIRTKLKQFLPVGQDIALAYDERLAMPPRPQS